jgi:hypothetical protein
MHGDFHIVKLLTCFKGRISMASACVMIESTSHLALARQTKIMLENDAQPSAFRLKGIPVTDDFLNEITRQSWLGQTDKAIACLSDAEAPILFTVQDALKRRGASLSNKQVLSEQAWKIHDSIKKSYNKRKVSQESSFRFVVEIERPADKTRIENQIRNLLDEGDSDAKPNAQVSVKLIRAASKATRGGYGAFANCKIAEGTILMELAGEFSLANQKTRNDKSVYAINDSSKNFVIDSAVFGNEACFINNTTRSNSEYEKANVRFLEVFVDGWLHIFILTLCPIDNGEQLLVELDDGVVRGKQLKRDLQDLVDEMKDISRIHGCV